MTHKDPEKRQEYQRKIDQRRAWRSQHPDLPRAKTLGTRRVGLPVFVDYPDVDRPRTRGECASGARPCPFVSCRHHLFLDVNDKGGLKLNFPHLEPDQLIASCSLDVAEGGLSRLEDAAVLMNLTRERIRQIEVVALRKLAVKRVIREMK